MNTRVFTEQQMLDAVEFGYKYHKEAKYYIQRPEIAAKEYVASLPTQGAVKSAEEILEPYKRYQSNPDIPDYLRRVVTIEDAIKAMNEYSGEGVLLSEKAKRYFNDVMYGLDPGNGEIATESDVINYCLETLSDFELVMDMDVLTFLAQPSQLPPNNEAMAPQS